MTIAAGRLIDVMVELPGGRPRLAVRTTSAVPAPPAVPASPAVPSLSSTTEPRRTFLLVHGLASNARLWDGVSTALVAAGHDALAVDLRGHGRSDAPDEGYDTATCAADLAALLTTLGLTGDRAPVVAGQSWGGNVALTLAAEHPGSVAAVACVDGGWIRLHDRFASFADCWAALAPPRFDRLTYADLARRIRSAHPDWPAAGIEGALANLVELPDGRVRARLAREHHADILRSLYEGDPGTLYPKVTVPVLLAPAVGGRPENGHGEDARQTATRAAVLEALDALTDAQVTWYADADHDLHAQFPDRLAADLLALATAVPARSEESPP